MLSRRGAPDFFSRRVKDFARRWCLPPHVRFSSSGVFSRRCPNRAYSLVRGCGLSLTSPCRVPGIRSRLRANLRSLPMRRFLSRLLGVGHSPARRPRPRSTALQVEGLESRLAPTGLVLNGGLTHFG